jgi:DNA-binding PadR family transcriptional regulator
MSSPRLTETSYIVLGLLEQAEPATPYDLKQFAQISVFNFWLIPHTQLYTECARLAEAGLLHERREESGRRRRFYTLTARGRQALDAWRSEPTEQLHEARDPATLKLFFGGDPAVLASTQLAAHERKLRELKQTDRDNPEMPDGMRLALEAGIGHEREFIRFWSRLSDGKGD